MHQYTRHQLINYQGGYHEIFFVCSYEQTKKFRSTYIMPLLQTVYILFCVKCIKFHQNRTFISKLFYRLSRMILSFSKLSICDLNFKAEIYLTWSKIQQGQGSSHVHSSVIKIAFQGIRKSANYENGNINKIQITFLKPWNHYTKTASLCLPQN